MKRLLLNVIVFAIAATGLLANGVAVIDGQNGIYLTLVSSEVRVSIENQVAVVTTTQLFHNPYNSDKSIKYAFPLSENASATSLRYKIDDVWYTATIAPTPQDTTLPGPGGETDWTLKSYLGETPLYYPVEQKFPSNSLVTIELTYVELLSYRFGDVQFVYPNDYTLLQATYLATQTLDLTLSSSRTIESIQLLSSHDLVTLLNTGNSATLQTLTSNAAADEDYRVIYTLSQDELGLFSISTKMDDALLPDNHGGFLMFVAEPDPENTTDVIDKVFTFIIDRSGSMMGEKIVQARDAASFVVNHLNEGDRFNIIDFSTGVRAFRSQHVEFNTSNKNDALNYISGLSANGLTNISGAFDLAVPQFNTASDNTANIIIFFTDGKPTTGISATDQLVSHITNLIQQTETNVFLFVFGIGPAVNKQLLTQLADNNQGIAEFLEDDELENRITEFYLRIRNPVLLSTQLSFSPDLITEVYPDPLPNLYKGSQMIVVGRYQEAGNVTAVLRGTAFGESIEYEYPVALAATNHSEYQFLTKLWAKMKIEKLLVDYYLLNSNSEEAMELKDAIIELSISWGVISPFTSYAEPTAVEEQGELQVTTGANTPRSFELIGNFPNPFNPETTIKFRVNAWIAGTARILIYNSLGQLVKVLNATVSGPGLYEVRWDGTSECGPALPSGTYCYLVELGNEIMAGKMQMIR